MDKTIDFLHMKKFELEKVNILCDFCYKFKKISWNIFTDIIEKNHPLIPCPECDLSLNEKT